MFTNSNMANLILTKDFIGSQAKVDYSKAYNLTMSGLDWNLKSLHYLLLWSKFCQHRNINQDFLALTSTCLLTQNNIIRRKRDYIDHHLEISIFTFYYYEFCIKVSCVLPHCSILIESYMGSGPLMPPPPAPLANTHRLALWLDKPVLRPAHVRFY